MSRAKTLVTGATGMTGSHAVQFRVLGTQITYQQASVDTFAESIGQTGNALFKEHCRAVAVELQEGIFAETNSFAAQISGRPPMTIEEFVAENRAAFI